MTITNTHVRERESVRELRGRVHLEVRHSGRLVIKEDDHNLIVEAGRAKLAKLLGGGYTGRITHVGVGTGQDPAEPGDTGLSDAVLVPVGNAEYEATSVRFPFEFGTEDANGLLIREFGLFFGDGSMFSRRVRKSIIGKESDIKITGFWEIYF